MRTHLHAFSEIPHIISETHNFPYPVSGLGYSANPGNVCAPLLKYAFTFSPYRNGSLPFTIPHSIRSATLPVTKGVAKDVPLTLVVPPFRPVVTISTPGATKSGFASPQGSNSPLPEKGAYVPVSASYAPTVITRSAVDGIVKVRFSVGNKKPVPRFNTLSPDIHIS